jgi:hypothetical protein
VQNEYNLLVTQAKREANLEYISKSDNKLKAAWTVIKKEAGITKTSPDLSISPGDLNKFFIESVENITSTSSSDKAKALSLLKKHTINKSRFKWKWVTPYEIFKVIKSLKNSNSKDIYGLSNNLLKCLNESITEPLSIIFNTCLQSGVFPHHLKYSKVTPVYKKGPKDDPNSYRPISVIPIIGKIFEVIIKSQLYNFFENSGFFSSSQYGFRKGKTTAQALQFITNIIHNSYENQLSVALTLCDLTKAFDCVSHSILLGKLKYYGISGVELSLFQSYLSLRLQCVEMEGVQSSSLPTQYGVPQGSVLGPILFLVMINDLPCSIPSNSILYADDTTLMDACKSIASAAGSAENHLSLAIDWFRVNGFVLNREKTQKLICSLESALGNQKPTKLLGFYLDTKLSWAYHITEVNKKLSKALFILRKLSTLVPSDFMRCIYSAFFNSHLEYGLEIWGNASDIKSVFRLQKKAIRILTKSPSREHCRPLFIKSKILTVYSMYVYRVLIYMKENLDLFPIRCATHTYSTRNNNSLSLNKCRLTKTQSSLPNLGIKLFNNLPISARMTSLPKFKSVIHAWLALHPLYSVDEFFKHKTCDILF